MVNRTSVKTGNRYRGNAIVVGVLLIACTAASILSIVPLGSTLDGPDFLSRLAPNGGAVVWSVLLEFAWAATAAGVAIALYPVIRRHNRALALGSVAGRAAEGVLVLSGAVSLLALQSLGQDSVLPGADPAAFRAAGDALLAMRSWALDFVALLPFLTAALLYYAVLYRTRLIPRWLSGWGIAGAVLGLVAAISSAYTQDFGFSPLTTVLNLPIAVQEMVLAVWLLAKGFAPQGEDGAEGIAQPAGAVRGDSRAHRSAFAR